MVMLNTPGHWAYFVSHVQRETAPEAILFAVRHEEVWLDRFMEDKSTAAMVEGVTNCRTFVCLLSASYFTSQFCLLELRTALRERRRIVTAYKAGVNVGALLAGAPDDVRKELLAIDAIMLDACDREFFDVGAKKLVNRVTNMQMDVHAPMQTKEFSPAHPIKKGTPKPASAITERIQVVATALGHEMTGRRKVHVIDSMLRSVEGSHGLDRALMVKLEALERHIAPSSVTVAA